VSVRKIFLAILFGFGLPSNIYIRGHKKELLLLEDTQLIAMVRNGNTDAFGQIIERYQLPMPSIFTG